MRLWTVRPTGLKNPCLASTASRKACLGDNARNYARHPVCHRGAHMFPRTPSYLRTRRRKTPGRQILLPSAHRSFTCTTRNCIQLLDDDDEEMAERSRRTRNVARPSRRNVDTLDRSPRDMRSIIKSREKIRVVEMSEVEEIEKQIPDAYKLRDELIDARYVDAKDYLDAMEYVNKLLRFSLVDVMGTKHMRHAQEKREYEAQYWKIVRDSVPRLEKSVAGIQKTTLKLYHELLRRELQHIEKSTAKLKRYFRDEFVRHRITAIRSVDKRLAYHENMSEQYGELQEKTQAVLYGMIHICAACSFLKSPATPGFPEHGRVLKNMKDIFSLRAHVAREGWSNYMMSQNPIQKTQDWNIQRFEVEYPIASSFKVMESIAFGRDSEEYAEVITGTETSIATQLQESFTKRWRGPKPQGSPEMHKAWRQLDIVAPLEILNAHTWLIQYELQYLIYALRGDYGPMFDHVNSAVHSPRSPLVKLYRNMASFRREFIKELRDYKYINCLRMESDDRLHKLGVPNVLRERGYLVVPNPLSQDMNRFTNWTNKYARLFTTAWAESKVLDMKVTKDKTAAFRFFRNLTALQKTMYENQVFHVPELGSKRRTLKRAMKAQRRKEQQDMEHEQKISAANPVAGDEPSSYAATLDAWDSASLEVPLPDFDLEDSSPNDYSCTDETPAQDSMDDETLEVKDTAPAASPNPASQSSGNSRGQKSKSGAKSRVSSRAYSTYREILSREYPEASRGTRYLHRWTPAFGTKAQERYRAYSTHRALLSQERHKDSQSETYDAVPSEKFPNCGESTIDSLEHIVDPEVEDDGPEFEGIVSKPLFWSHNSRTRPDGGKLIVHYCRSLASTEEVAKHFLNSPVVGFDMEWKSNASANHSIQSNLSLIQIANEERIALFQIALFKPARDLSDLVAPSLKQLMESPDITKVGVSIKADTTRLRKYLGIEAASIFELSHLHRLVKYGKSNPKLVNKKPINLSDQVKEHLGRPLNKIEDVRCSDWSRPLNYNQVQYAATDPYASFCLFHALDEKRLAMNPVPPRPAHAELNLPITLPSGNPVNEEPESSTLP